MADLEPWTSTKFLSFTAHSTHTLTTQPSDWGLHPSLSAQSHIIVRNPPRTHLPPESGQFYETRCPGKLIRVSTGELYLTRPDSLPAPFELSSTVWGSNRRENNRMSKRRPSLQSLFTPSFLNSPTSPTSPDIGTTHVTNGFIPRAHSSPSVEQVLRSHPSVYRDPSPTYPFVTSPRSSPPPAFLIDDDPFANLSSAPYPSSSHHTPPLPIPPSSPPVKAVPAPRSPLTPNATETKSVFFTRPGPSSATVLPSGVSRALSGRARPAHQKPAFSPRPSLPSLHTLAKMNVAFTPKVRKGRVGAKLPSEPWDNLDSVQRTPTTPPEPSSSQEYSYSFAFPNPSSASDFVSDLDSDFLDLSSDEEMDDTELTHHAASTTYDLLDEDNAHPAQLDLTYGMDTETTASDTSPPSLSRSTASSSLSSLTRSTSFTSNSSSGSSSDVHQYSTSFSHSNATDSDSDILGSPPEDFLSFPASRSNAITDPFWSYHSRFDDTDLEIDPHASQFPDISYLKEPKEIVHEPGTSADTIRPSMNFKADPGSDSGPQMEDDQVVDGVGWEQGQGGDRRGFSSGQGSDGASGRAYGSNCGDGHFSNTGRGRFGGRGDDDDDDDQQRNKMSTFSTPSDSELSDETEDESTDYGVAESSPPEAASPSSSDDDVPLAQRIPTALQAQRTIRRQVREEREKRRKERATRAEQLRGRQPTLLPAGAGEPLAQSIVSSSQEAAFHASLSLRRPRTNTLPSTATRPFSPEDLSRRLQTMEAVEAPVTRPYRSPSISIKPKDVIETPGGAGRSLLGTEPNQVAEVLPASITSHHRSASVAVKSKDMAVDRPGSSHRNLRDAGPVLPQTLEASLLVASTMRHHRSTSIKPKDVTMERPGSAGRNLRDVQNVAPPVMNPLPEGHRALRPARSFHRPERRKLDDHLAEPMPSIPIDVEHKLSRSLTRTRPRGESIGSHPYPHNASSHPLPVHTPMEDKLPRQSGEELRKVIKATEPRSARPSVELERPSRPSTQRPPVPPLPAAEAISGPVNRGLVTQQRIFIGDMQRFNMVEIGPLTNGGDVIEIVEAQGSLKEWVGSGDWMVWEVAQDFGMERPVRSFELLADIQASWNKDKMMNAFMIKLTPLALPLSRLAIPSASPTHAGYVDWQMKRGKWAKRWLQLREHNLYLAKRDNGRDEVFLCALSNFDAYFITRVHKTPRPFAFAVKSTDKLSFFENTADYLHVFSCGEKEGNVWMEKILVARSYVLHQEKQVLFNPKAINGNAAGGLTRAATRKVSSSARPQQPLVSASPPHHGPLVSLGRNDVFEPGSLLRKQL